MLDEIVAKGINLTSDIAIVLCRRATSTGDAAREIGHEAEVSSAWSCSRSRTRIARAFICVPGSGWRKLRGEDLKLFESYRHDIDTRSTRG
jgi:hypothetical protein